MATLAQERGQFLAQQGFIFEQGDTGHAFILQ